MDASWAGVTVAVIVGLGSLVGFFVNRQDIKLVRDAADEVHWALSESNERGTLLLTNLGRNTAYDVQAEGGVRVKTHFEPGHIAGRGAKKVICFSDWQGEVTLTVTWATSEGSTARREWTHPYAVTAPQPG